MTHLAAPACLFIIVCLAMTGCGSDDEPTEASTGEKAAVAAAARSYFTALGNLNPKGVCNSLTKEAQRELVAQSGASDTNCERVLGLGFQGLSKQQREALAQQITLVPFQIEVTGETATGLVQLEGQTSRFEAAKVDGQWKLSSPGEQAIVAQ